MRESDLARAMEQAAHRGARQALREVGLDGADAAADIHDLRVLLKEWRQVKRTARQTVVRAFIKAFLWLVALGAAVKFGLPEIWKHKP